ncbi:MAG: hypothetical protein M1827_004248 [Pycnora praestabilis]|nr:MAG: hypothetical protein M1827_004248 [Pycnora praestabilis]
MTETRLLLTGATGYIGGSVLSTLLSTKNVSLKTLQISALVRRSHQAQQLSGKGVIPILIKSLDDTETIQRAAAGHDVVIHTASGFHGGSARALIRGLAERKKRVGKEVYYVHTSGTSNLADQPITGKYTEDRVFSDNDEDIYAYEVMREKAQTYHQRTTDITVIETGKIECVKTYIIMPPTIYGIGSGYFNRGTIQVPGMIRAALAEGQASVIGDGKGQWNGVHIADLAVLYELLLIKLLEEDHGKALRDAEIEAEDVLPSGEMGFYFAAAVDFTWHQLSVGIANACVELAPDRVRTQELKQIDLEQAKVFWPGADQLLLELGFASKYVCSQSPDLNCVFAPSSSRTIAKRSRQILGWKPQKTQENFKSHFVDEVRLVLNQDSRTREEATDFSSH